jgi:diphthamide synthase (EF-2-diphthine--ammonia ligase)
MGFQTKIIELDTVWGANKNWIGKDLDIKLIDEMEKLEKQQKINSSGELGAYHTFVLDCPVFKKKIKILESEVFWEKTKGYFVIKKATLQPKN